MNYLKLLQYKDFELNNFKFRRYYQNKLENLYGGKALVNLFKVQKLCFNIVISKV